MLRPDTLLRHFDTTISVESGLTRVTRSKLAKALSIARGVAENDVRGRRSDLGSEACARCARVLNLLPKEVEGGVKERQELTRGRQQSRRGGTKGMRLAQRGESLEIAAWAPNWAGGGSLLQRCVCVCAV